MKKLLLITLLMVAAVTAYAAKPELPVDGKGIRVQGFAPSGKKTVALTVVKQHINHTDDIAVSIYSPTACTFRLHSTNTRVGGVNLVLPANAVTQRVINPATPYISYSGCASGQVQVQ